MTYEESIEQLNNLLRRCGIGFNKTDIEAIDFIIKETQELKKQLEEYKEQIRIKDEYLSIILDLANNYKINDLDLWLLAVYEDDSFNTVKGLKSLVKNIGRYAKYALDSEDEETIYLNCYGQKLNILKEVL